MVNNTIISLNQFVIQNPGNIVSDMDGEKVMLSVKNGKYYNLGGIGSVIWDLIEKKISINQLVKTLMSNYNVEQSDCEKHVLSFLEELQGEGLVVISDIA